MRQRVVCVTTIALVWLMLVQPMSAMASPCWRPPVSGTVVDPFRAPTCWYCVGHRGIEYGVTPSTAVRAVAAGTVTYSGTITGVMYVVVQHANGWKITYGKLTSSDLQRGDRVTARSQIGRATDRMYFGLRIGGEYRDPTPYLGRAVGSPRLVPVDGSPQRSAPPPVWRCRPSA
ncbi:murein hydrolase activator EnvC family protein [Ilumatobacter sp.]|uniref:murein hydrolase activator EnvC family protein n=1 Tax=Ilumatobacter sp. TaxID=1967498 RepID=UPI00375142FD